MNHVKPLTSKPGAHNKGSTKQNRCHCVFLFTSNTTNVTQTSLLSFDELLHRNEHTATPTKHLADD